MAENRFAKYLDQQPATNRFAKYAEAEAGRDKVFSKGGSALVGMGDMGTFGLRDEAAGGQAARQSMLPDWLNRGLDSAAGGLPIVQAGIGAIDAAIGITTENTGKEGQKSYDDMVARRDNQRAINSMAQTDNPLSYLAGGVVGSVAAAPIPALGVGKTVGGTMAKVGLEGAAFGGAMGFGSSEGDLGDRAKAGGEGAVIGGAAGAVLGPVAQYVLGPVIKGAAYKAFTPDRVKALDQVLIKAEQSGTSLDDVKAGFEKWSATGEVPEVLAEIMGAQERGLLSAVVTESAASRETAAGVLLGRGRNEVNILERGFAKAMNAKGEDLPKAVAAANKARSEDPEAFYAPAHFAKDGSLKPLRPDQQSNLNNILVEEDDVVRILKDAQSDLNRSGNKSARDEVRLYREAMAKIQKGEPASLPTLSVQAGDYIERSINQSYKAAYGSSGTVSGSARGWRNQRDAVRAVVDDGTGIAEARSTAAERIRRTELLDEGRKFLNPSTDVEDVRGVLRGDPELDIAPASPEGRTAYTAGAARGIRDKLQNVPDMKGFADATRAIARTPAVREKIAAVLPQETVTDKSILAIKKRLADGKKLTGKQQKRVDEYGKNYDQKQNSKQTRLNNELDDTIERVANRSDFTTNMLGNSRTAFRQADADAAAFDGSMQAGVGRAVNDLISNGPAAAQARGWQKLGQAAEKYIARPPVQNPKINAEMARILLAQGEAIPEQLQRLAARQLKRGGKPNPTNALAIGAGKAPAAAPKGPVRGAGFVGGKAPPEAPLSKAKFHQEYMVHKDIRGRKDGTSKANAEAIARDGFRRSANVNAVPPYRGGEPTNIAQQSYAPRKGDTIYLVSKSHWKDAPNGPQVQDGWKPKPHEIIEVTEDYPDVYELYRKALTPKDPVRGAGFMLPEKTGRPIGFHDDMPRGTKRFNSEKLTDSQNKSVEMARNGYSNAEIAEEMEISANAVSVHLRNARLRGVDYPASKTGKQPTTRTDILRAAESGAKATAIAERLGISPVQVRVTLSRARKAVKEAGDDVPEWLKPQTAGLDVGSEVSQFGIGAGIGAQGAQDIDGDGKISLAERAAGAAAGYGVIKGGARLSKGSVRGAGFTGKPPKTPKKRLGRGLDSLMDDAAPVRSPASKTTAGNALAPQPRTGADWTEAERKAFINSGHEEGLIPIEPDSSFVTVKAARKSIKKLGIDYRVGDTNDYESGFPVLASVLGAGGVTAGTLGLLSAYLNQRPKSNVPPEMAKARAKLADTAATAYQKDPNGDEFRNTMIRLQQMDRKIEGGSEAEPRSPSYKPRKLSPRPAGITGDMLKRAGQKTGNALAMTEGKLNTGAERAAGYVRDRLRTAEMPKRPIDLLKESEMKRNRQGQFVRDMETKRANDALWQRNGYTGYRGRKMTPAELRAQGKGSK